MVVRSFDPVGITRGDTETKQGFREEFPEVTEVPGVPQVTEVPEVIGVSPCKKSDDMKMSVQFKT